MTKETTPHDLFFAKLMEDKEMARSLFKSYFPEAVQKYIQFDTAEMKHLNPKFVNDVLSGYRVCDVLYEATSPDGVTLLFAHAEHQSTPDEAIVLRAICYALLAVLDYHKDNKGKPIPPILTLIYYNGETPYKHSMDPLALFGDLPPDLRELVLFKPQLIDLTQLSDQEFTAHGPLAPFETLFKHSHDKADYQKLRLFDKTLVNVPGPFLVPALQYTLSCIETSQREAFITMISTHVEKKAFVSIADSFKAEGKAEGVSETAEAIARNLLLKGLDLKFVAESTGLDIDVVKRIQQSIH